MNYEVPYYERLERVRRSLKWSYAKLGQFFGVSDVAAMYWCKNQSPVPLSVIGYIPMLEDAAADEAARELVKGLLVATVVGAVTWYLDYRSKKKASKKKASKTTMKSKTTMEEDTNGGGD